jgi:large subunit ribosomal protein L6
MSRIGKQPIDLPKGTTAAISGRTVTVKGPLGELSFEVHPGIEIQQEGNQILVLNRINPENPNAGRALHGVSRAMVANLVEGTSKGFQKGLEIVGTGWRAALTGRTLEISLGYAKPVQVPIPDGLTAEVADKPPRIMIKGIRKDQVGQFAADIRALRPPEPYLGKGIRYDKEEVRKKAGKSAG